LYTFVVVTLKEERTNYKGTSLSISIYV